MDVVRARWNSAGRRRAGRFGIARALAPAPVKPPLVQFCRAWVSVAVVPATQSGSEPLKAVDVVCALSPVMSFHWALVE